jgi:hypothetical protein
MSQRVRLIGNRVPAIIMPIIEVHLDGWDDMSTLFGFLFSHWALVYGPWLGLWLYNETSDVRDIPGYQGVWDRGYQRRWHDIVRRLPAAS